MNFNFPCKCGHTKSEHKLRGRNQLSSCYTCLENYCGREDRKFIIGSIEDPHHFYLKDNLKYLEQKYEENLNK